MKIKLSRSQWQEIGKIAGWIKTAKIQASEAYTPQGSIDTIVKGKRNIAAVGGIEEEEIQNICEENNLKYLKIPQEANYMYIIYRDTVKNNAYELANIVMNNSGYLANKNENEIRKIGQLLEYEDQDIENFIKKCKKLNLFK